MSQNEFLTVLFARADAQDLARYTPQDLQQLAAGAYAHLAEPRQPGHVDIRLIDYVVVGAGAPREITVLEVINDNMPFLLDSTLAEIAEQGIEPALVAHPIIAVERDADGTFRKLGGARRESLLHIHLARIDDTATRDRLIEGLALVYRDVRVAVDDWVAMRTRVYELVQSYRLSPPPLPPEEITEAIAFLNWVNEDNFTFLGVRDAASRRAMPPPIQCRARAWGCCAIPR